MIVFQTPLREGRGAEFTEGGKTRVFLFHDLPVFIQGPSTRNGTGFCTKSRLAGTAHLNDAIRCTFFPFHGGEELRGTDELVVGAARSKHRHIIVRRGDLDGAGLRGIEDDGVPFARERAKIHRHVVAEFDRGVRERHVSVRSGDISLLHMKDRVRRDELTARADRHGVLVVFRPNRDVRGTTADPFEDDVRVLINVECGNRFLDGIGLAVRHDRHLRRPEGYFLIRLHSVSSLHKNRAGTAFHRKCMPSFKGRFRLGTIGVHAEETAVNRHFFLGLKLCIGRTATGTPVTVIVRHVQSDLSLRVNRDVASAHLKARSLCGTALSVVLQRCHHDRSRISRSDIDVPSSFHGEVGFMRRIPTIGVLNHNGVAGVCLHSDISTDVKLNVSAVSMNQNRGLSFRFRLLP